jgi:anaerobic magnesium-protoporphyrin IX monomethyl ester cyclase
VAFFDAMLSPGVEEFHQHLRKVQPHIVLLVEDNFNYLTKMCTLRMREAAFHMIAAAKGLGCKVAVNGSDATDREVSYFGAGVEAIILGEPEDTVVELVDAWSADPSPPLSSIPGLALMGPEDVPYRTSALPVRVQLVCETHIRQAVRSTEPCQRGRRVQTTAARHQSGSHLVRR